MRLTYLIVVIAILISFSRLYLRVHYLSDVIGGIILGVFSGTIVVMIFKWIGIIKAYINIFLSNLDEK